MLLLSQKLLVYMIVFIITLYSHFCDTKARIPDPYENLRNKTSIPLRELPLEESTRLPMKGESGINYGNLETSEPGFTFTDEEIQKLKIWPGGTIPYFIDDFSYDKVLRDKLRAFLDHTNSETGVYFTELSQPPDDDSRWVFFINRRGVLPCADLDFRKFNSTGVQKVVIGYDCMEPGNLEEIALALAGVPAQHNAPDRDKYVQVQKENILPGKEHLFEKFSDSEWLFHDVEYDFTSAGHYGYHKYTANGGATLKPLEVVDVRAGEATSFSVSDIWKIRMLYNYIAKNGRKGKDDTGCCSKLFKPGAKFRDFIPDQDEEDEIKPRSKPNKYTGIKSEEISPKLDNIDNDDEEDQNKENAYKNEGNNKDDSIAEDEVQSSEKSNLKPSKLKEKGRKQKETIKKPKNPLQLMSDIETDE